jgi:hypothetical protein
LNTATNLVPPGTPTASGFVMLADRYHRAGRYCLHGIKQKQLKLFPEEPVFFLFSHSIELSFKAWLLNHNYLQPDLKSLGHRLANLREETLGKGLALDELQILQLYAKRISKLHFDEDGNVITELQRLRQNAESVLREEVNRHFALLHACHSETFVLRYSQTGFFSTPNIHLSEATSEVLLNRVWETVLQTGPRNP